jgi:peptide/nickel transport system permease protein
MQAYILRRVLLMIPTLFLVAIGIFVLTHLLPGDVIMIKLEGAASYTPEQYDTIQKELGMDKPYIYQLGKWLWGVSHLDLGNSLWAPVPVADEIFARLPTTLQLAGMAFVVSSILGITLGVLAAIRQDSYVDHISRIFAVGGLSLPDFWVGTLMLLLPIIWWNWTFQTIYTDPWVDFGNNMKLMIPAATAIGIRASASVMRLTRTTMLEVLRNDFIRTAHAKGLKEQVVIYRHALRNALIPVVTIMGTQLSRLLGGTVIVEMLFAIPGVGRLFLDSITSRDITQVQGNIMVIAGIFIMMNLIVDISYGFLDPRIRYGRL